MDEKRESKRKASQAYRQRQLATNPIEYAERQRGYARKCFRIYYYTNKEYRERHKKEAREKAYYDNSNNQFLLVLRKLFIAPDVTGFA